MPSGMVHLGQCFVGQSPSMNLREYGTTDTCATIPGRTRPSIAKIMRDRGLAGLIIRSRSRIGMDERTLKVVAGGEGELFRLLEYGEHEY